MFDISYSNQSEKFLKKCDKEFSKRILEKIDNLRDNPYPSDMKRLKDKNAFRIRVGKFRVLYLVNTSNNVILITKMDKRSRAYG